MSTPDNLSDLTFTRTWLSAEDFPTIEPDETTVREDLQFHPDAIKMYINETLVPAYNALLAAGLKSPGSLTLAGAVTAKYDGSSDVTVTIPIGSGGDAVTATVTLTATLGSDGTSVIFSSLPTGYTNAFALIKDSYNQGQATQVKLSGSKGKELLALTAIAKDFSSATFTAISPAATVSASGWHVLTVSSAGVGTYASTTLSAALEGKQDILTFDTTPTSGSTKPVTSGGVKTAITSTKVNTTLSASSWTSAKKYTLNNSYITATSPVELLPRENSGITQAQMEALSGAMIVGGTQAAGSIQLVALGDVPTIDIPVTLIIRRDL